MGILIDKVRIKGFRGLKNIEVSLEPVTVLTGMNNTGKTTFLKALQIVLGNSHFISQDDFNINGANQEDKIIIDIRIVPFSDGKIQDLFDEDWEIVFTENRIVDGSDAKQFVPIRTEVMFEPLTSTFKTTQNILKEWGAFKTDEGENWHESPIGKKSSIHLDQMPFIYMDAQRDVIEDMKVRGSFIGKLLSNIKYTKKDIDEIEKKIEDLNTKAVQSSPILSNIENTLKDLDSAIDNGSSGVDIAPFAKKVRDLNKGVSIQYSNFSMEYHGMGTRSWSSLLTLKSFITFLNDSSQIGSEPFFPLIAIEEPEAHLHPNAQKKLYSQMAEITGQKIISTHSPFIAASANLNHIRSFYKKAEEIKCGKVNIEEFGDEEIRRIKRQVISSRGELFFAKAIVLAEGETEEQALPIFAEKYFDAKALELGIDFIGVNGKGNYLPFLRFAQALNIPSFIYSDADGDTKEKVRMQLEKLDNFPNDFVFYLNDGNDFEKQLIQDGYQDEIRKAIISCETTFDDHSNRIKAIKDRTEGLGNSDLYKKITGSKTQYGPAVAEAIIKSEKDLPPLVVQLFDKIFNEI
jgi:putative ATP-dependent endonuclease of OLD family